MRQTTAVNGKLFLLGGDTLRFLVEEPINLVLKGITVCNIENENEFGPDAIAAFKSKEPVCLVVEAQALKECPVKWVNRIRNRFSWLPIVLLGHNELQIAGDCGLPQLMESVAVIQYPYTQKTVINAIEQSVWWSVNLCRMIERVSLFENLSERELAIVSMATDGLPNKSMARRLNVSIKTIEKNRRTAYEKLKISSSAEMAALVTFRRYFSRSVVSESNKGVEETSVLPIPSLPIPGAYTMHVAD